MKFIVSVSLYFHFVRWLIQKNGRNFAPSVRYYLLCERSKSIINLHKYFKSFGIGTRGYILTRENSFIGDILSSLVNFLAEIIKNIFILFFLNKRKSFKRLNDKHTVGYSIEHVMSLDKNKMEMEFMWFLALPK